MKRKTRIYVYRAFLFVWNRFRTQLKLSNGISIDTERIMLPFNVQTSAPKKITFSEAVSSSFLFRKKTLTSHLCFWFHFIVVIVVFVYVFLQLMNYLISQGRGQFGTNSCPNSIVKKLLQKTTTAIKWAFWCSQFRLWTYSLLLPGAQSMNSVHFEVCRSQFEPD